MKILFTISLLCILNLASAQITANAGPDQEICIFDSLRLNGLGLNANDTGSYEWTDVSTGVISSSKASFTLRIFKNLAVSYALKVTKKTNGNTFYSYDTVNVTVNNLPAFTYKGIAPLCYNNGCVQLTLGKIVTLGNGKSDSIRFYQRKNPSWISGGPAGAQPYAYCFGNFVSNALVPKTGLRDTICYDYTDANGCYNKECKPIRINPTPVVETRNGLFCQTDSILLDPLVAKPFSKVGGIQNFRVITCPPGADKDKIISTISTTTPQQNFLYVGQAGDTSKAGDYYIEYCFKDAITGCQSCDTSLVQVTRLPKIVFSTLPSLCINDSLLALDSFVTDGFTGKRLPYTAWNTVEYGGSRDFSNPDTKNKILNTVKNGKYFNPSLGSGSYLLKFNNMASGCPASDSVMILVNGLPNVVISTPDKVCANGGIFNLVNITPSGNVGTWSGDGVNGSNFDPSSLADSQLLVNTKVKYAYTNSLTNCTSSDSATIVVQNNPKFKIKAFPHSGKRFLVDFSLTGRFYFDSLNSSFFWTFNGVNSTLLNPVNISYPDSGTYKSYVRVMYDGCATTDSITFDLNYRTVSIADVERLISIYPNPAKVNITASMPFDALITVYDINGKVLASKTHHASAGSDFNVSGWAKGIYMLAVKSQDHVVWKKILVD